MWKRLAYAVLVLSLMAEASAVAYYVGQNSVEAIKIPVFVDVEVPEKYTQSMHLAVYADGRIEKCEESGPADKTGLLYIVHLDYSPVGKEGSYGWHEVTVVLDFGDLGTGAFSVSVPCGPYRVRVEQITKPEKTAEEGY